MVLGQREVVSELRKMPHNWSLVHAFRRRGPASILKIPRALFREAYCPIWFGPLTLRTIRRSEGFGRSSTISLLLDLPLLLPSAKSTEPHLFITRKSSIFKEWKLVRFLKDKVHPEVWWSVFQSCLQSRTQFFFGMPNRND